MQYGGRGRKTKKTIIMSEPVLNINVDTISMDISEPTTKQVTASIKNILKQPTKIVKQATKKSDISSEIIQQVKKSPTPFKKKKKIVDINQIPISERWKHDIYRANVKKLISNINQKNQDAKLRFRRIRNPVCV